MTSCLALRRSLALVLAALFWTSGCSSSVCGNGSRESGEECDDGNAINGDGCDFSCDAEVGFQCNAGGCAPICGDGRVVFGEVCDGAYCTDDCTAMTGSCGDGVLQIEEGELCDDGNDSVEDGCNGCVASYGFECDPTTTSCTATGIAPGRTFGQLTNAEWAQLCDWLEDLLTPSVRCGGLVWSYVGDAACRRDLPDAFPPNCTVQAYEAYTAAAGSWCATLDIPFECDEVCTGDPCDPVAGCGCPEGQVCGLASLNLAECRAPEPDPRGLDESCNGPGNCDPGLACFDIRQIDSVPFNRCLRLCAENADCDALVAGTECLTGDDQFFGFCSSDCSVLTGAGCDAETICRPVVDDEGTGYAPVCLPPGSARLGNVGDPCVNNGQCAARLVCGAFVEGTFCGEACEADADCGGAPARCFETSTPGIGVCGFPA